MAMGVPIAAYASQQSEGPSVDRYAYVAPGAGFRAAAPSGSSGDAIAVGANPRPTIYSLAPDSLLSGPS